MKLKYIIKLTKLNNENGGDEIKIYNVVISCLTDFYS